MSSPTMLRDLLSRNQPDAEHDEKQEKQEKQENRKPTGENSHTSAAAPPKKDDDEFVPVSHEDVEAAGEDDDNDDDDESEMHRILRPLLGLQRQGQRNRGAAANKYDDLHPYAQILSLSNLGDCVALEKAAFPEHERCSRDKFIYRLTKCPELSLGLFSRPTLSDGANSTAPVKAKLIAHVIATRTPAPAVTDASMGLPGDWEARRSSLPRPGEDEPIGHQEEGRTIALHSLAVAAEHQKKGLGTVVMKAYIQRIKDSKIADRIALLAHDPLIAFYEGLGFVNMGPSACKFGGGGWNNMILEFKDMAEDV